MEFKFNFRREAAGTEASIIPGDSSEAQAQAQGAARGSQPGGPGLREHRVGQVDNKMALTAGAPGLECLGTDRVPGLYEGGLKVWECTFDLLAYLGGLELRGRRVLDLGCGAGLLGVAALRQRAAEVHFQDYNGAVIEGVTIPNVALSEGEGSRPSPGGEEGPALEDGEDRHDRPPGKQREDEESPGGKEQPDLEDDEDRHNGPPGKQREDEESPGGKEQPDLEDDEDGHHGPPGKRSKDEASLDGKEGHDLEDDEDRHDRPPEKRSKDRESPSSPKSGMLSRCRFFSGEWSHFSKVHANNSSFKYDVILTSETLYNPDCYRALHDTLSSLLSEKGKVYLASKAHYFGVGGGIHLFESFVKENKVFEIETVKVIDDGLQRCIAVMSFRRDKCS